MTYLNVENIKKTTDGIEYHPLMPFLPENCKVLFLGSFPPPRKRWSKDFDFFYPNFINDHWRIEGLVFFNDRNHFVDERKKRFKLDIIVPFLLEKGIGFFDTATAVRRLNGNASDKFLEVVEKTDIARLLERIPNCKAIVTTGEKATGIIRETFNLTEMPRVGTCVSIPKTPGIKSDVVLYRLPSSSRAYPLSLDKKAAAYREMFTSMGLCE